MTNYLNSTSFILKYPPILHWLPDQLLPIIQQNFPGICLGFRSRTVHYFQPLWREEKLLSGTIYFPQLLKKNKQKLTFSFDLQFYFDRCHDGYSHDIIIKMLYKHYEVQECSVPAQQSSYLYSLMSLIYLIYINEYTPSTKQISVP